MKAEAIGGFQKSVSKDLSFNGAELQDTRLENVSLGIEIAKLHKSYMNPEIN